MVDIDAFLKYVCFAYHNSLDLFKRITSILTANIFGQVCTVLIQFVGVPLFLHYWGQQRYGEWLMIIALPTYLNIAGTGIGFVSGNKMQMLSANGKFEEAGAVFSNALAMICMLAAFFLFIVVPMVLLLPIHYWFNIKVNNSQDVTVTLLIFSFYILFTFIAEIFMGVYRANGLFARGIFFMNLLRILEFVAVIIGVVFGCGIAVAALLYLTVRVVGIFWMIGECARTPWLRFSFKQASWPSMMTELQTVVSFVGVPASQALLIQGMTTIVGMRLGPSSVVVFTISRTLTNVIKQFTSVIHNAVLQEFSVSIAKKDLQFARVIHRISFQITFWFATVSSLLLYFLSDWVMKLWTANKVDVDHLFFILMLLAIVPNTLSTVSSFVPASINKFSTIAFTSVFNAIFCVITTYVFIPYLGIIAVPVTFLFAEAIMFLFVMKLSLKILDDSVGAFANQVFFTFTIRKFSDLKAHLMAK